MRDDKELFQFAVSEIESLRTRNSKLQAHVNLTERLLALFETTPNHGPSVAMSEDVVGLLRKRIAEMDNKRVGMVIGPPPDSE